MVPILLFLSFVPTGGALAETGDLALANSVALRHRMAIVPLSAGSTRPDNVQQFVAILEPRGLIHEDGLLVATEDWAHLVDLAKSEIAKSQLVSVVELPAIGKSEHQLSDLADKVELVLIIGYGSGDGKDGVIFRLVQASSGQLIYASKTSGVDLAAAVRKALSEIENEVFRLPWHCSVMATKDGKMIINRGRMDGLIVGMELVGYSMALEPDGDNLEPAELRLMKYGKKKGLYKVVEARRNYSSVEPSTSATGLLAKGDILEQPEIFIRPRDVQSRGKRAWDDIYNK